MIKNIDKVPNQSYFNAHYFCDYIELLALINNDLISVNDVYDRFLEDENIHIPENTSDADLGSNASIIYDEWENRIKEWFYILEIRKSVFNSFYPFIVANNTLKLVSNLSFKHKIYLFLLLSSNQNYMQNNNQLTSDFEELSLNALRSFLPNTALCYRFGKSVLRGKYTGHITAKIDKLAKDLKYATKYQEHYFSKTDNGDGGLDLVSWIPFKGDENQNNIQVYLCQCATGKEWYKKQNDIDKFIDNYIDFKTQVNSVIFIPFDNRNADRMYNEEKEIKKNILFDRIRLLYLLEDKEDTISKLKSFQIVDEIIEFEEDIV